MSGSKGPLETLPKDDTGRLTSGIYRPFPHWQIDEAVANGWVRLTPNVPHPLEEYGDWLRWDKGGAPWVPTKD